MIFMLVGCAKKENELSKSENTKNIHEDAEILRIAGEIVKAEDVELEYDSHFEGWIGTQQFYGKYLPEISIGDATCYHQVKYEATSTYNDGKIDYTVDNLSNEFSTEHSWVEGVEGYGIGEKNYNTYG